MSTDAQFYLETFDNWTESFDRRTLQRGEDYAQRGMVQLGKIDDMIVQARCKGSNGELYAQYIQLDVSEDGFQVTGRCTCPVAKDCKHCAAVLYHLRDLPVSAEEAPAAMPTDLQHWLRDLEAHDAKPAIQRPENKGRALYYLLGLERQHCTVQVLKGTAQPDGSVRMSRIHSLYDLLYDPPRYLLEEDLRHLRMLKALQDTGGRSDITTLQDTQGAELLEQILATGRLLLLKELPPLRQGPERHAEFRWVRLDNGNYQGQWYCDGQPIPRILPLQPLFYVDWESNRSMGRLTHDLDPYIARQLSLAPIVPEHLVVPLSHRLHALNRKMPTPTQVEEQLLADIPPRPCLTLGSHESSVYAPKTGRMQRQLQHRAALAFDYDGSRVSGKDGQAISRYTAERSQRIARQLDVEKQLRESLLQLGFTVATRQSKALPDNAGEMLQLPTDHAWLDFARSGLPRLREAGWKVEIKPDFAFNLQDVDDWYADIDEVPGHQWFDLEVGIVVGGQRHSLLPILLQLLRSNPELLRASELARRSDDDHLLIDLNRARHDTPALRVALPYGRIKPLMATLGELYLTDDNGPAVRLAAPDAARLSHIDTLPMTWRGGEQLRDFARRLNTAQRAEISAPEGLNANLRPYQLDGLKWLQTLRSLGVGGILGDDMGLGKTLQTLAHLLCEKQAGRLQRPALVVMPTSLIPNWLDEAERFAPQLRVLALHGAARTRRFGEIQDHDLVLTTYALLPRDLEHFKAQPWHVLVLDEAQNIKNATSKAAEAARSIEAGQRLCLTGTPMENNLGELWSIVHFLMPGWLGDSKSFARDYRTPIERHGDSERMAHLAARIRPFLLRRTKEQVATELPPKTEIVHWVDLSDAQRDTYETVRVALDKKVREEITRNGAARSQIVILDALLKLRQVCCDLRLVKSATVKTSQSDKGKLGSLMEMLDELLSEGRRILLFSQFTSMLALIEEELHKRKVAYSLLTGDTRDRRKPVEAFQKGETPLFLISLKAGGTGLNLTAADTVIHYDPWWNPASESQATDRAYRIGQDKPVFVYKMITRGTVEEKIQQLQQEKAALAAGLLEGREGGDWKLGDDEVQALFAPLPGVRKGGKSG